MKAILVIDEMPDECSNCPVYHYRHGMCGATYEHIGVDEENEKPSWCPLKPMPKRRLHEYEQVDDEYGYVEGWNACLEEMETE